MTDQEFQERVLVWIDHTEDWKTQTDNRIDNLEGRMDNLEGRMDNLEGRMDNLEGRMSNIQERMGNLEERMGSLLEGVAWIRGKLEGRRETDAALWGKIAVFAAIGSAIIALLAYFK